MYIYIMNIERNVRKRVQTEEWITLCEEPPIFNELATRTPCLMHELIIIKQNTHCSFYTAIFPLVIVPVFRKIVLL